MALTETQIKQTENVVRESLRKRFSTYNPEPAYMPFHTRLLGKDRLALYSFIHSLNTNFGTSIFEPVALSLASTSFASATSQATAGTEISEGAQKVIQQIMDGLSTAVTSPNKPNEIEKIRKVCRDGAMIKVKPTKVDVKLVSKDNEMFLFDIKTAKPNSGGFKEFKRTLLEWVAISLAADPTAKVNTMIAIPYNPYEPEPYNRWTMRGMLDLENELSVSIEFWDFVGGVGAYESLLDCFERVGNELRKEIDQFFERYS